MTDQHDLFPTSPERRRPTSSILKFEAIELDSLKCTICGKGPVVSVAPGTRDFSYQLPGTSRKTYVERPIPVSAYCADHWGRIKSSAVGNPTAR
jgi:hypothetical protein